MSCSPKLTHLLAPWHCQALATLLALDSEVKFMCLSAELTWVSTQGFFLIFDREDALAVQGITFMVEPSFKICSILSWNVFFQFHSGRCFLSQFPDISWRIISWHFIIFPATSWHFLSFHNSSCYLMIFPVISWHFLSFYDISCHFLLFFAISCYFKTFHASS